MLPQVHSNLNGVSWDSTATECRQQGLEGILERRTNLSLNFALD
jgi:hypothetical protein